MQQDQQHAAKHSKDLIWATAEPFPIKLKSLETLARMHPNAPAFIKIHKYYTTWSEMQQDQQNAAKTLQGF